MTPERLAYLRQQATEAHAMDRDALNECLDEIEQLQKANDDLADDKTANTARLQETLRANYEAHFAEEREQIFVRVRAMLMWVPKEDANRQWFESVDKGVQHIAETSGGTLPQHGLTPCSYHKGFKEDCGCE